MGIVSRCGVFLTAAVFAFSSLPAHASNPLQVKTDKGKVEGKKSADGEIGDFLGIPYAAPPIGSLRWKPPQPVAKWDGVRQAMSFGSHCMQPAIYDDMIFRDPGNSEDCLTLNVWTPTTDKKAKLPVMVWIYGGGYFAGGTSEARQDGEHLAAKGVVVVSMNYRLGIFGFFVHPELVAESPQHAAGNYGLMDQSAALQWVHNNIKAFGGDPKNVTIFGESAGSFSVSSQMASLLSQGLFAHAIGESGAAFPGSALSFESVALRGKRDVDFIQSVLGKSNLAALRAVSGDELLKASMAKNDGHTIRFSPDVDGYFLPESVQSIYAAGKQAHVPLLAGWNRDEATGTVTNAPEKPSAATMQALAQKDFPGQADEFLKVYAASDDQGYFRAAADYAGDHFLVYSTWAWLDAHGKTGGSPVYRYRLDLPSPGDKYHPVSAGAFHSDDIEYVFGNLDSRQGAKWRPEDRKLSELIQTYWTNFARTGDPNSTGLPNWPVYEAASQWLVMHLDATPQVRPDEHRDRYLFLQQAWGKKREQAVGNSH